MIKSVQYPAFLFDGIQPNHRAYPLDRNMRLMAGDTETCLGQPMTLQLCDGVEVFFEYVTASSIFRRFKDWAFPQCRSRGVNIMYFHYLRFDTPVVFIKKRLSIYEQVSEVEFTLEGVDCRMLFGKVNKWDLSYKDRKLTVLDSWAFTQAGLDASLKMYKIAYEKHPRPKRLGLIRYDGLRADDSERLEFESYARQDVRGLWHLGRAVMDRHQEYKVRPSISLPQFAARVFRHHFMQAGESIQFPPEPVVKASELSYHGGKNGLY